MTQHELWFERPAEAWTEALPLGNGKLGAMVFGGHPRTRLQINDGTAWSGSPASEFAEPQIDPAVAAQALADARAAVDAEDYPRADEALKRVQHRYGQSYLPFADLRLEISIPGAGQTNAENFRRTLDLREATHETNYRLNGIRLTERTFISHRDNVLVHEIRADGAEVDIELTLTSLLRVLSRTTDARTGEATLHLKMPSDVAPLHDEVSEPVRYSDDDSLSMQGAVALRVVHDGVCMADDATSTLSIRNARSVVILLGTETTFAGIAQQPVGTAADAAVRLRGRLDSVGRIGLESLRKRHIADHSALYGRVELETGVVPELPIDKRLRRGNAHPGGPLAEDPSLAATLFHYGRYLLISSSREGGVPANLQGIWNESLQPPWSSSYTTNINLQMNYWLAEIANLTPCLPPLFDLIEALSITGRRAARDVYGAPGWVSHHNTDVWAYPLPVGGGEHDPKWAFWPTAGPWLIRHYWERVLHGAGDDFIADRAWHPTRSAAEFALAWLVEQRDGTLGTSPSTSPENQFFTPGGAIASSARSSTYDLVVIADLFDILVAFAERLGVTDDPVVAAAAAARGRIPDPAIGADGTVQEWADDFEFPDPTHRHVAHLYFLHPGDRPIEPALAHAASRSLDLREDESTGWSLVWKLIMRARLGQPEKVSDLMKLVFRDMEIDRGPWIGGLYPNLMVAHPPFQIDGNFGFVAGLAECIVQSHAGGIDLLKAMPTELAEGRVTGLRVRPGLEVDVEWGPDAFGAPGLRSFRLSAAVSSAQGDHVVRYDGSEIIVTVGERPVEIETSAFSVRSHAGAS